jgi:hypothetical protein
VNYSVDTASLQHLIKVATVSIGALKHDLCRVLEWNGP